jgi:hypothetical protein
LAEKDSALLCAGAASAAAQADNALTKTVMQTEYLAQKTNINRL